MLKIISTATQYPYISLFYFLENSKDIGLQQTHDIIKDWDSLKSNWKFDSPKEMSVFSLSVHALTVNDLDFATSEKQHALITFIAVI